MKKLMYLLLLSTSIVYGQSVDPNFYIPANKETAALRMELAPNSIATTLKRCAIKKVGLIKNRGSLLMCGWEFDCTKCDEVTPMVSISPINSEYTLAGYTVSELEAISKDHHGTCPEIVYDYKLYHCKFCGMMIRKQHGTGSFIHYYNDNFLNDKRDYGYNNCQDFKRGYMVNGNEFLGARTK